MEPILLLMKFWFKEKHEGKGTNSLGSFVDSDALVTVPSDFSFVILCILLLQLFVLEKKWMLWILRITCAPARCAPPTRRHKPWCGSVRASYVIKAAPMFFAYSPPLHRARDRERTLYLSRSRALCLLLPVRTAPAKVALVSFFLSLFPLFVSSRGAVGRALRSSGQFVSELTHTRIVARSVLRFFAFAAENKD